MNSFRLRNRYMACTAASATGRNAYFVIVAWITTGITQSPTAIAVMLAAGSIAEFLTCNLGGTIVDRYDRRFICFVCDVLRVGIMAATVLGLWYAEPVRVLLLSWIAYAVVDRTYLTALQALIPSFVAPDRLLRANSMACLSMQTGNLVAAILAGLLLVTVPRHYSLLMPAACFALSMWAISSSHFTNAHEDRSSRVTRRDLLPGAPPAGPLRLVAFVYSLIYAMGMLVSVLASVLVLQELKGTGLHFGYLEAAWAAGSIGGCVYMLFAAARAQGLTAHLLFSGVVLAVFLVEQNLILSLIQMILLGISYNVARVVTDVEVQRLMPPSSLGRSRSQIHTVCVALGLGLYSFIAIGGNDLLPSVVFGSFGLVMIAGALFVFVRQRGGLAAGRPS